MALAGFPLALAPFWWNRGAAPAAGGSAVRRAGWFLALVPIPYLVLFPLGLAGISIRTLAVLLLAMTVVAAFLSIRRLRGRRGGAPAEGGRGVAIPIVSSLAVAFLLGAFLGAPLGPFDDALDHLATVRHLVDANRLELPGAFYGRDQPPGADPRKGVISLALAVATVISGRDPATIWRASAAILAPILLLAFLAPALALGRGHRRVAWLALPALLFLGGDPIALTRGAYGGHFGLALAWGTIGALLAGEGSLFALLAGAGLAAVHAYAPAQAIAPLLLFALLSRGGKGDGDAWPVVPPLGSVLRIAIGALPIEIVRLVISAPASNPLHEQAMPWLLLPPGAIASPLTLLDWYGAATLAALPALLILLSGRGAPRGALFLFATGLAPALLLLNPWVFEAVGSRFGSIANKLALVWSPPLVFLFALSGTASPGRGRSAARLAAALFLIPFALTARETLVALSKPTPDHPWTLPLPVARMIEASTPRDAVIAADPLTSYAIPALTGRRVTVTLHQHAPPGDRRAGDRLNVAAGLVATCVPLDDALAAERREGATYLLLGPHPGFRVDEFGSHRDPRNSPALAERFATLSSIAPLRDARDGFRLHDLAALPEGADRPVPAGASGDDRPPDFIVRGGGVAAGVDSSAVMHRRRGEIFRLPIRWRREASPTPERYAEVTAQLRIESESLRAVSGSGPFSKITRRLFVEPRGGEILRARGVELPFRGLCPIVDWPPGEWLQDTLQVVIPDKLKRGPAILRLSLEEGTLYPRLRPADLFSNDDRYAGRIIGRIVID